MTDPFPMLRPVGPAEITPDNLRAVLLDMGREHGWYATGELYAWYLGMCQEAALEPVSVKKFADSIRDLGYRPQTKSVAGKPTRGWFLSRRAWRTGDDALSSGQRGRDVPLTP